MKKVELYKLLKAIILAYILAWIATLGMVTGDMNRNVDIANSNYLINVLIIKHAAFLGYTLCISIDFLLRNREMGSRMFLTPYLDAKSNALAVMLLFCLIPHDRDKYLGNLTSFNPMFFEAFKVVAFFIFINGLIYFCVSLAERSNRKAS